MLDVFTRLRNAVTNRLPFTGRDTNSDTDGGLTPDCNNRNLYRRHGKTREQKRRGCSDCFDGYVCPEHARCTECPDWYNCSH